MKKRTLAILVIIPFASAMVVTGMLLLSPLYTVLLDDFSRNVRVEVLSDPIAYKLDTGRHEVAGVHEEEVYFTNESSPFKAIVIDFQSGQSSGVNFRDFLPDNTKFRRSRVAVVANSVMMYDRSGTLFCTGPLNAKNVRCDSSLHFIFQQAIPVSDETVVFQSVVKDADAGAPINIMGVFDTGDGLVELHPKFFEGQDNNYYLTQGMLRYSSTVGKLVYVYRYSGRFVVTDTLLSQQVQRTTIDKNTQAAIKPFRLSDNRYTLASPNLVVNINARVFQDLLLIQSNVAAGNEKEGSITDRTVIDVYRIEDGAYEFSFYVPGKVTDFEVTGDRFIALRHDLVMVYDFKI